MTTAPARNASRQKWADFLDAEGVDYPDNATRADLADLWNLRDDTPAAEAPDAVTEQALDYKPSPNPRIADQVPAELRFSTDSGDHFEPEKILIDLNGRPAYLYEPPKALLILIAASLSPESPIEEKLRAMLNLLSSCLDSAAERELRAAMNSRTRVFDDDIIGQLVAVIFDRWAPTLDADTQVRAPQNRAQRRANARK